MIDLRQLSVGLFRLPSWFAIFVVLAGRAFFSADFGEVRPVQVVEGIFQPIFFIHGEDDQVISAKETVELHIISDYREDRVWIVPGAEHVNVYCRMPEAYVNGSLSFSSDTSCETARFLEWVRVQQPTR